MHIGRSLARKTEGSTAFSTFSANHDSRICLLLMLWMVSSLLASARAQGLPIDIQVIGNHRLEAGEIVELQLLHKEHPTCQMVSLSTASP